MFLESSRTGAAPAPTAKLASTYALNTPLILNRCQREKKKIELPKVLFSENLENHVTVHPARIQVEVSEFIWHHLS